MHRKPHYYSSLFLLVCVIIALLHPSVSPAATCDKWIAKAVSVQGTVEVRRSGETQWRAVKLNDTFCPGDTVRVLEKSRADLALVNQPLLRLDQDTTITLKGLQEEKTSLIDMLKGAAHFFSRTPKSVGVTTSFVNAGVEGTEFLVRVDDKGAFISVFEGRVLASNQSGSVSLVSGQSAVAEPGKAPEIRLVAKPRDAVQWTLYFPAVAYYRPSDFQDLPGNAQRAVRQSMDAYMRRDFKGAIDGLNVLPEDLRNPRLLAYRASLLLAVGRVDEARKDIDAAMRIAPNSSDALALQSIIATVRNEKAEALSLGKKAVDADPKSASARVALSYALQAEFNLEGALESLKEAVKIDPENALAWARLSEMWLSFGELRKSLEAAKKAASINPDLARTQTVLGFAYLMEVKTDEAKKAFTKAIELDQADPLPRLGLGLATIRDGDLKEGTKEIEVATSLNPGNSLIRSYMGKAYFEEKNEKLAAEEYKTAKELDPKDPTPFFYDAILKQTTNRPVEALYDIQKAMELNDNRAVYRSRLLLDADLAARSASLARIYADLGFQQRALVEGWNSVNLDPADFSGHRFLADTYAALPRHEIARVSELLISQLLQPINITPIQPRLAESNLFAVSGGGPSDLSFSEFNPLFNRNRAALQLSGMVGENSTWGGEAVASGIYNKFSASVGYYHNQTDGFRENAYLKDNIFDAFLQYSPLPQTSIQSEFRYRNLKNGDLALRFYQNDFAPRLQNEIETSSVRLGFHHQFAPGSDLIGNFMYQHGDVSREDSPASFLPLLSDKFDDDAYSAELQYLYRSKYINLVGGAGYFRVNSDNESITVINFPPPTPFLSTLKRNIDHTNLYLYSYINLLKNVTLTVGASADFYQGGLKDENQFNPKFGVTWNPLPGTALRGAVFRTLKRTLITNQTLEPTQVAGFNQFYDDTDETDAWTYGVAIDQKLFKSLFVGASFFLRDLKFPFANVNVATGSTFVDQEKWHERVGSAYAYWTPHKWFGLTAEYLFERFTRDEGFRLGLDNVDTHRVPLGINFYHPCGLSVNLKTTYVNQHGKFERQNPFPTQIFQTGEDQFWLFDAAINYRLPKRYGFISFGVKNLFDRHFQYYDTDPVSPAIQPDRFIYGKITLALP